jgi:hypothetical protein
MSKIEILINANSVFLSHVLHFYKIPEQGTEQNPISCVKNMKICSLKNNVSAII